MYNKNVLISAKLVKFDTVTQILSKKNCIFAHNIFVNKSKAYKMSTNEISARLDALRAEMSANGISAVIIPHTDYHLSEYIADHWQARRFLSGFTGSAGTLVVTSTHALLWTDSRYFLQGAQQLEGTGIELMKEGLPATPSIARYLITSLPKGSTVGLDGMLMSIDALAELRRELDEAGLKLDVTFDAIDKVWTDRPSLPPSEVFIHDVKYAGQEAKEKIAAVLANASSQGADNVFISALDEIAWILNIRSRDVESNPVATSFLYLSQNGSTLFIDPVKINDEVRAYLSASGVAVAPYDSVITYLSALPEGERVLVASNQTSGTVAATLGRRAIVGKSAAAMLKAVKNDVQIAGIRNAMVRDGVAMVKSLREIEETVAAGKPISEIGVAAILTKYRSQQELYFDNSFDTIAGYGAHGAIVHYSATPETDSAIVTGNLLLIDSGAQYLDGTTDITRTIALGTPTTEQRRDFTLVMKGHIAVARVVYPAGTRGAQLDVLARMFLWHEGKSYLHGTGHGVGHFLNVHEGPQSIRLNDTMAPLTPGMITSNEPGVYLSDRYGIRCENLVLTVPAMTTEFGDFYKFETLTLCPFDRNLFDTSIMTPEEIGWLNKYHATVKEKLMPYLTDEADRRWLEEKTEPLTK